MTGRPWTASELQRLRELYPETPVRRLAQVLARSCGSIKARAQLLALRRNRVYQRWTRREISVLRRIFSDLSTAEAARRVGHTLLSTCHMAAKLGLRKSAAYMAKLNMAAIRSLRGSGRSYRFPKGHVPMNKGLRRPGYSAGRGRMQETQFGKGLRPQNWRPVGTIKPNADGYLRMKVRDDRECVAGKGASSTNWMFVHRMVWESAHGPIPPGHRIWWKDKNHLNCALDNLELLSDVEHMARTTFHTLPADLKEVIHAKASLTRAIHGIERKKEKWRKINSQTCVTTYSKPSSSSRIKTHRWTSIGRK